MPERKEILDESRRLLAVLRQTRLRLVESELSAAFTLCAAAETYINMGRIDQARRMIEKARPAAQSAQGALAKTHDILLMQREAMDSRMAKLH